MIAVRLETVERKGVSQPLKAVFDSGVRRFKQSGPFSTRADIGSVVEMNTQAKESDVGALEFWDSDPDRAVKTRLLSNWITAATLELAAQASTDFLTISRGI
jgi:hypothetical protein